MPLLLIVFAPAVAALVVTLLPRNALSRWVIAVPLAIFAYLVTQFVPLQSETVVVPWVPSLGLSLEFYGDGLGMFFALIISGIGTLVLLYASGYFDNHAYYIRFSAYTLLFMSSMLGIVLSANLLLLFIFWELTSITSYLLIGFKHESEAAREGARTALLVTGGGGLILMAGVLLLGFVGGTFHIPTLLASGDIIRDHPLYTLILILILIGAFSKSAQWPLHFWLPGAMEAPTPASAYLHSATMVKAGVFLLARLSLILNGTDLWFYTVTVIGLITFLYGAVIALRQTDLKAILAYSTVSWLGILVALQGAGSKDGAKALIVGILAHALYKGALFLTAGSIDHATGTRDITRLGQLRRNMPITALGALVAVVSMAGIPPLLGFLAKETLKVAALYEGLPAAFQLIFPACAVLGSALTVAVALRIFWDTFFGNTPADTPHPAHEVTPAMWIGPFTLGILSIALSFLLAQVLDPLLNAALYSITGTHGDVHLHLFEGINTPFILSMVAILIGLALFWVRRPVIAWLQARPDLNPVAIYRWLFLYALPDGAQWLTMRLQNGKLSSYIVVVSASFVALTWSLLVLGNVQLINNQTFLGLDWTVIIICGMLIVGAIAGVLAPSRLAAISVFGVEGALISLLFALYGAPDLAFTQLMIEVISLVLFVLAFHFLPDAFTFTPARSRHLRDLLVALGVGITAALLVLVAGANQVGESISPWFIQNALPIGQGHNVVNIILVDFRGMDTQGEIIVLVIAAMGVAALLRLRPSDQPRGRHLSSDTQTLPAVTEPLTEDLPGESS